MLHTWNSSSSDMNLLHTTSTCSYYMLHTTCYILHATYYILLTTYYIPQNASSRDMDLLHTTYYLLLTTYYILLTSNASSSEMASLKRTCHWSARSHSAPSHKSLDRLAFIEASPWLSLPPGSCSGACTSREADLCLKPAAYPDEIPASPRTETQS